MIDPTVIRGLSDAYGSWKMICISLRSARSERLSSVVTFCAPNQTSPDVGSMSRRIERPVRSEEHTSELQSRQYLVCRLLLEKKKKTKNKLKNDQTTKYNKAK